MKVNQSIHLQLVLPKLRQFIVDQQTTNTPNLTTFLKRAKKTVAAAMSQQQLLTLFNFPQQSWPPIAAITALADGLATKNYWLRADPVSLRVDLVHIYMLGNSQLSLHVDEVEQLAAMLNQHLAQENLHLYTPHPLRWYLQCPKLPDIETHNPEEIFGRTIADYFPQGAERNYWLTLLTELQMLLHTAPINQQRAARGVAKIDALWLWGAGELPQITANAHLFTKIYTDNPLAKGLAILNRIRVVDLQNIVAAIKMASEHPGHYLICSDLCLDENSSEQLFALLLDLLKKKNITTTRLFPGDGYCYDLDRRDLRPWWWPRMRAP
jgi:hypothetical protein